MRKFKQKTKLFFWHFSGYAWQFLKGVAFGLIAVAFCCLVALFAYLYLRNLVAPNLKTFLEKQFPVSSKIYSRDGVFMYEYYDSARRTPVPLGQISPWLIQATIAVEDKHFYSHKGISPEGIIRSAILNFNNNDFSYGGSTITQQLIKNLLLTKQKNLSRKISEIIWAIEIESRLSKDQILESYLNQISYGRNLYGAESAAKGYFDKPAKDLSLAESAYLAALPKAPSLLSPNGPGRKDLDFRKTYVLNEMRQMGFITEEEKLAADKTEVVFRRDEHPILAPHFVLWLKQVLIEKYGKKTVEEGGLIITASLNLEMQREAEKLVKEFAEKNKIKYRANNAALVALDPKTGEILAMVGSKGYFSAAEPSGCVPGKNCRFDPNTNIATSLRQPGSSFKPYVYLTAFGPEFKFSPSSYILDKVMNFSPPGAPAYMPQNYNLRQYGRVTLRKALAGSLNVATVRLGAQIGTEAIITNIRKLGITAPFQNCGLSLTLGSCEITLLEHTAGFGGIANLGLSNGYTGILKIEDSSGNSLFYNNPNQIQAINPEAAYETVSIMTDNVSRSYIFGSKTPLAFENYTVAAKTGTTQNWKDGWTLGFTPNLAVGVWTGNNNGDLMAKGADGIFTAAPLWRAFMDYALPLRPKEEFPVPTGIKKLPVNLQTGKAILGKTQNRTYDYFAEYSLATEPVKPKETTTPRKSKITVEDIETLNKLKTAESGKTENNSVNVPNGEISASFTYPNPDSVFLNLPIYTQIKTTGTDNIQRVELLLDGKYYDSSSGPLFVFKIEGNITDGLHILIARTVSKNGAIIDSDPLFVNLYRN